MSLYGSLFFSLSCDHPARLLLLYFPTAQPIFLPFWNIPKTSDSRLFGHQWETFRWTPLCSTSALASQSDTFGMCEDSLDALSTIVAFVLLLFEELASLTDHRFSFRLPLGAFLRFKGAHT